VVGAERLTVEELEAHFRAAKDVVERSHFQVIWLLAKGHSRGEVAELVALSPRWVSALWQRYAAGGVAALGDQRRRNPGAKRLMSAADLEALRERLRTPPDDGGIWSGPKVAGWIAARLGLEHVHAPRGWEALKKLGWSIQAPRPQNPKAASAAEQEAFKKSLPACSPRKPTSTPACRSSFGPRTSTGSACRGGRGGLGRGAARVRLRLAITASNGSTLPPSSRRSAARRYGICPTA
jgi:transposase